MLSFKLQIIIQTIFLWYRLPLKVGPFKRAADEPFLRALKKSTEFVYCVPSRSTSLPQAMLQLISKDFPNFRNGFSAVAFPTGLSMDLDSTQIGYTGFFYFYGVITKCVMMLVYLR